MYLVLNEKTIDAIVECNKNPNKNMKSILDDTNDINNPFKPSNQIDEKEQDTGSIYKYSH